MHVNERRVGQFRILAEAVPSPKGGFTAAVTVTPREGDASDSLFCDLSLADGFVFKESAAAMKHAFDVGHGQVRLHAASA